MGTQRESNSVVKREHLIALAVAVSLHAGLAAALTFSSPAKPLDIKLDLGFEIVDLSPIEMPVTSSTPVIKENPPAKALPPKPAIEKLAQLEPPEPVVKKAIEPLPESVTPEVIDNTIPKATPEVVAMPEPEPAPLKDKREIPSMLTDTHDALTAEQATDLPLLVASINDEYIPPISSSRYLHNPKPDYPRIARKRGMEGLVMVNVRVNREGHPIEALIHTSSGYGVLDRAALRTVRSWRFEAARRGNTRVEGEVLVPINFELTNNKG